MVTIYHNPRCGKSRQTLKLLQDRGVDVQIVEYLRQPLDARTIDGLLNLLGMQPLELIRSNEPVFKELKLESADRATLIAAMAKHPILIQRPIVVNGKKARLGRPPEAVLGIL